MNAGMLWFDNDPKTALTAKIERAVDYYRHKYGRDPNLCLIHPSMLPFQMEESEERETTKWENYGPPLSPGLAGSSVDRYRRNTLTISHPLSSLLAHLVTCPEFIEGYWLTGCAI